MSIESCVEAGVAASPGEDEVACAVVGTQIAIIGVDAITIEGLVSGVCVTEGVG